MLAFLLWFPEVQFPQSDSKKANDTQIFSNVH